MPGPVGGRPQGSLDCEFAFFCFFLLSTFCLRLEVVPMPPDFFQKVIGNDWNSSNIVEGHGGAGRADLPVRRDDSA
jgi:hypothetical protein